jgi:hypothetical protein
MLSLVAILLTAEPCSASQYVCASEDRPQFVEGLKAPLRLWQFLGLYDWDGPLVSGSSYGGWAFGGPLVPLLDGNSAQFLTIR